MERKERLKIPPPPREILLEWERDVTNYKAINGGSQLIFTAEQIEKARDEMGEAQANPVQLQARRESVERALQEGGAFKVETGRLHVTERQRVHAWAEMIDSRIENHREAVVNNAIRSGARIEFTKRQIRDAKAEMKQVKILHDKILSRLNFPQLWKESGLLP